MTENLQVEVVYAADRSVLDSIQAQLDSPKSLLTALADDIRAWEKDVFASGGEGKWPADQPVTLQHKNGTQVLIDSGSLLRSLTQYPATDAVQRVDGDSVLVATTDVAGLMNQRGAHGSPKRNPAPAPTSARLKQWSQHLLDLLLAEAT